MTDRELMQQALDALKLIDEAMPFPVAKLTIKNMSDRLAQQGQEPVTYTTGHCEQHKQNGGCQLHNLQCGWPDCDRKPISTPPKMQPCAGRNCGSTNPNLHSAECFEDYEKSAGMAQPVALESVYETIIHWDEGGGKRSRRELARRIVALYTSPPAQRTWVALTDEEIAQGCKESWVTEQAWQSAVWWAEAKLKEKNT